MRRRVAKGLFGIMDRNRNGNVTLKEFFVPFSAADANQDFAITNEEFSSTLNKGKKRICMSYKIKQSALNAKAWFKKGVPASEQKGQN